MRAVGILDLAHRFKVHAGLLAFLVVADLAGILFGWYYYVQVGQFDLQHLACGAGARADCQPVWWWPLVADSPNAVLLFLAAVLWFRLTGRRSRLLDALAFTLNIYVGLWTTALFLSYPDAMGTFRFGSTNNVLFVTHMGMPLQSLVLVRDMRRDAWSWRGAAGLLLVFGLFVLVDYAGPHLHPAPFLHRGPGDQVVGLPGDLWLGWVSPFLMAIAAACWVWVVRPRRMMGGKE